MKRIGILTSGGDCQGLNASIRGVAKSLYEEFGNDVEIYGIKDGYKGLIFGEYKLMKPEDFSGILTLGGTILGTSRQPFKLMRVPDKDGIDKVEAINTHIISFIWIVSLFLEEMELIRQQIFFVRKDLM